MEGVLFFSKSISFFLWLYRTASRTWVPDWGLNQCPPQRTHGVSALGFPGGVFLTKLFTAEIRLCSPSTNVHPNSHLPCRPRDNCAPCVATAGRVVCQRKARELTTPRWPAAASGCAPVGTDGEGPNETQRRTHRVTGTLTLVTIR